MFKYFKKKFNKFLTKIRSKILLWQVDRIVKKRENYFKDVEKDINSFWYPKK